MKNLTPQEQQFLEQTQAQIDEEYEKEYRPLNRVKTFFNTWTTSFFIQFLLLYVLTPFVIGLFDSKLAVEMKAIVTQPYVFLTALVLITYLSLLACKRKPKPAVAVAFIAEQGQRTTTDDK